MLDIERLLTNLGIEYRSAGSENVKTFCISPSHDESEPSMSIHRASGVVHCFGCGFSGNIFTLLAHKGFTGIEALVFLQKFPAAGISQEELEQTLKNYITTRGDPVEETVQYGDIELPVHRAITSHAYLEKRGITPEDIVKWNMAVVTRSKNLGWILIPIYQDGVLCNYFMRNTFGSGKMYGSYPRKHILAGLDFYNDYDSSICVSEGIFDAISVSHAGFQSVACLSNKLLQPQLEKLKKFKEVIIVPDNDVMGVRLVESAGMLIHNCAVWVVPLPHNRKDAGECSASEITQAFMNRVSWKEYIIMKKFT